MSRILSPAGFLPLLLWAGSRASATFLYVSSYSGAVTTLNLTLPAGDGITLLDAVSTTQGCTESPSWLTLDFPNAVVYCVDEGLTSDVGSLSSFSTSDDGSLTELDKVTTLLGPVASAKYGEGGNGLALPHYSGSGLTTWDISDPSAIKSVQEEKFTLSAPGTDPARQDAPHPHFTVLDPTGNFVLVPDLGADLVRVYAVPSTGLTLTALDPLSVAAGSGPRHIAFAVHGDKIFMYLVNELANTIIGYSLTYGDGTIDFEELFSIGSFGDGKPVPEGAAVAEVVVSANADFVVVSSRNDTSFEIPNFDSTNSTTITSDSLINYAIDGDTGSLTLLQTVPSGGSFPRQFSMNKAGTLVAVGSQYDGRVTVTERDPETGKLGDFVAYANVEGQITSVIFDE